MDGGLSVDSANESTILLTTNCGGADHGQDPGSLTTVPGDREHVPVAQEESPNLASVHALLPGATAPLSIRMWRGPWG